MHMWWQLNNSLLRKQNCQCQYEVIHIMCSRIGKCVIHFWIILIRNYHPVIINYSIWLHIVWIGRIYLHFCQYTIQLNTITHQIQPKKFLPLRQHVHPLSIRKLRNISVTFAYAKLQHGQWLIHWNGCQ